MASETKNIDKQWSADLQRHLLKEPLLITEKEVAEKKLKKKKKDEIIDDEDVENELIEEKREEDGVRAVKKKRKKVTEVQKKIKGRKENNWSVEDMEPISGSSSEVGLLGGRGKGHRRGTSFEREGGYGRDGGYVNGGGYVWWMHETSNKTRNSQIINVNF